MAHDVFISYSHHDKAVADAVCATLEQHQVRCWIAPRDVVAGEEWGKSIVEAIHSCRVLVLVFSANANDSPQICREIERAVNRSVIIVPFRIEDVLPTKSLEYFMGVVHWLDAMSPPLETHLNRLAETVRNFLEQPVAAEARGSQPDIRLNLSLKPAGRPRKRFFTAPRIVAAVLALLVAVGALAVWRHLNPPLKIPRIAIIGPANNSSNPKYDYLTTQIGDVVSTDLAQAGKLNAVPRNDVVQTQEDVSLPADPCAGKTHPAPLEDALVATYLIFGSFHENGSPSRSNLHVALCLLDSSGKVLDTFEQDTDESSGAIFSAQVADRFRHDIAGSLAPQDFRGIYPQDPEASRLYFEGLSEMRAFNASKAEESLQQAAAKEDTSPLIHAALSQAWSMLRYDQKAADEANAAVARLPKSFPLEFDSVIRAGAAEMNKQWPTAVSLYASLHNSYPERLDFGLKLASVQTEASTPKTALSTLDGLAKLPKPLGQDPRILIEKSRALMALSDYSGSIKAAEAASQTAKQKKFPVMEANADLQLCWAYQKTGDIDKARSACDQAQQTFRAFHDDVSAAVALNDIATWLTDRHRYADAEQAYDQVVSVHRNAHDQKDLAGALINRARVAILDGHPEQAVPDLARAVETAGKIQDKYDQAIALVHLAEISRENGKIEDMATQAAQARDFAHSIPDPDVEASALSALALAQSEAGQPVQALDTCKTLLKLRKDPADIATTWTRMGDIFLRLGRLPEARRKYQDAYNSYDHLQKPDDAAPVLLQLAEVDIDDEKFPKAEDEARQALAALHDPDSQADATAYILRALVGQGEAKFPEAETRLKTLQGMKITDDEVGFDAPLGEGTALVAIGRPQDALGTLDTAASDAKAKGQRFTALQLQLVSAQALAKSGKAPEARNALSGIRSQAQISGSSLSRTRQH